MTGTRPPVLAGIGVVAGTLGWAFGFLVAGSDSDLPRVPHAASAVLAMLAALLAGLALSTRVRLRAVRERHPDAESLDPLAVARFGVLARASSPVGSAVAGGYGGYTVFLVGEVASPAGSGLVWGAGSAAAAGVALAAAALALEAVCRLPGDGGAESAAPDVDGLPDPGTES